MNDIGKRIRDLRLQNGMTQDDLASAVGTTKQNIYKYENGIITNIPLDRIELIAKALHTSPASIMGWRDNPPPVADPLTPEETRLLRAYRAADATYRSVALELLEGHPAEKHIKKTFA